MISIQLPDGYSYELEYAVFDYNGTLALDGVLSAPVKTMLVELAKTIQVSIITADTFGMARGELEGVAGVTLIVLKDGEGGMEKARYVKELGRERVVAVGNGMNDKSMFNIAALSICVAGMEGASIDTLLASHIVVPNAEAAIGLLLNPKRLVATLRR